MTVSGLGDAHADSSRESFGDVSGQTAPAAFSLLSLHGANQLWPNSAPELITIEQLNPTGSNSTSFAEVPRKAVVCFALFIIFFTIHWVNVCNYVFGPRRGFLYATNVLLLLRLVLFLVVVTFF